MSGVSFPVTRPVGRVLVVGNPTHRPEPLRVLSQQGYDCAEADDPYAAMMELCRHRLGYQALILSLASLYREELHLIATVKRRLPHVEIWLTQTDGRLASLAEGMRLGADGLLADDGSLHRVATSQSVNHDLLSSTTGGTEISGQNTARIEQSIENIETSSDANGNNDDSTIGEPVLTAEELRALLQDQPSMPPTE